ncbi:MAG: hypothetical protein ACK55O_11185 [Phycisphaerales bacterium]|jgi:hypothetical protein|nr:hypothetical protein [Phycisphaeraceae bacterium]
MTQALATITDSTMTPGVMLLGDGSGPIAIFICLGILTLVALLGMCLKWVRKNQVTFATCIIILTIAVTTVSMGLLMGVVHRFFGDQLTGNYSTTR